MHFDKKVSNYLNLHSREKNFFHKLNILIEKLLLISPAYSCEIQSLKKYTKPILVLPTNEKHLETSPSPSSENPSRKTPRYTLNSERFRCISLHLSKFVN